MAQLQNTTINDTGFLKLPSGNTANRPTVGASAAGMIRFNTSTSSPEWYDDAYQSWFPLGEVSPTATGGTVTNITQNGVTYRVHTFLSSDTFTVTRSGTVEYLIIGGGGAGGGNLSGGGGAGGVLTGSYLVEADAYPIIVGDGGARFTSSTVNSQTGGLSNPGKPSSAFGLVASGGGAGGGGSSGIEATTGGSAGGGGGYVARNAVLGTEGQGHRGGKGTTSGNNYRAGGGGGAGGPGGDTTNSGGRGGYGGPGIASYIEGSLIWYAGGGGGGAYSVSSGGHGGIGGGGGGGANGPEGGTGGQGRTNGGDGYGNSLGSVASSLPVGGDGGANTGSGGGGVGHQTALSGAGGSGIVVVRYRTS